jgi:hypothetical protein
MEKERRHRMAGAPSHNGGLQAVGSWLFLALCTLLVIPAETCACWRWKSSFRRVFHSQYVDQLGPLSDNVPETIGGQIIRPGMTYQQVLKKLGQPVWIMNRARDSQDNSFTVVYHDSQAAWDLTFRRYPSGTVRLVLIVPWPGW